MKARLLLLTILVLSGCATAPPEIPINAIDANAVARHQQQVSAITAWQLTGQIALFNLKTDERDAVYLEWQQSPEVLNLRFYHPLKGTLARLEETSTGAVYYDEDGQAYYDASAEDLIQRLFALKLPLTLLRSVVTGKQPEQARAQNFQLFDQAELPEAVLTAYEVDDQQQQWQVQLAQYERQTNGILLPTEAQLENSAWRVKLRIRKWQL